MNNVDKKLKVLVTATGGPTAIGVIKCLKDKKDILLIGADAKKNNPGAMYCSKSYVIHRMDSPEYLPDIKKIIAEENIDVIIPTMQDEIEIYHDIDLGVYIALPVTKHFECLTNKHRLYEYLSKEYSDIVPNYVLFTENSELEDIAKKHFASAKRFCIKKVSGHGGIGFAVLSSDEETLVKAIEAHENVMPLSLFSQTKTNGQMMAMEYVEGKEYSVDVLVHNNKTIACVPRVRNRVSTGIVIEGSLCKDDEIIKLASSIAEDLIEDGFVNIQFIKNDREIKLIDLNARFCGSQVHSFGAGVNFPYLLMSYEVLKRDMPVDINWNTTMVRYWESCFYYD